MSSLPGRVGAFVLVIALVAGGATAGGLVADDAPDRIDASVDNDYYVSASVVEGSSLAPAAGEISFQDDGTEKTVLIHHDGDDAELEPFVDALVTAGHRVTFFDGAPATGSMPADPAADSPLNASLREADAFVAVGTVDGFTADDVDGIEAFAEADGRVLLADDLSGGTDVSQVILGSQTAPVDAGTEDAAARFGVAFGSGYLYNMHENDANFRRVYASGSESELADGVDRLVVDAAVPVRSADGTPIATGTDGTHYSTTREEGEYHVGVRTGNVVALGDTDLFAPIDYNRADNEVLLGNLLEFLTTGEKEPADAPERPEAPGGGTGEYPPVEEPPVEEPPTEEPPEADEGSASEGDSVGD